VPLFSAKGHHSGDFFDETVVFTLKRHKNNAVKITNILSFYRLLGYRWILQIQIMAN
jgi:hypothetical protein